MNKKLTKLTESDIHRIVKESVSKVIGEGFDIDTKNNVYYHKPENQGCMPYVLQLFKIVSKMREEILSLYDKAYQYYDTNDEFRNSNDKDFQIYYWNLFKDLFEKINSYGDNMASECEKAEDEIKNALDKWDDDVFMERGSFMRLSNSVYNNK